MPWPRSVASEFRPNRQQEPGHDDCHELTAAMDAKSNPKRGAGRDPIAARSRRDLRRLRFYATCAFDVKVEPNAGHDLCGWSIWPMQVGAA